MKEITAEWLKAAQYDIKTVEKILDDEFLTPVASFHCQQIIEKCFKAILEENEQEAGKIHSLKTLYKKAAKFINIQMDETLLTKLDELYIESRYPGEFGLLHYGRPTLQDVSKFFSYALEIYDEIKTVLEKIHE